MPKSKEMISESDSEEEVKQKSKSKPSKEQKKRKEESSSAENSESEDDTKKSTKRQKKSNDSEDSSTKPKKDENGNLYWELDGKRRVTLKKYMNSNFVDIREMFEKDGKFNFTKKGISLNLDAWKTLSDIIGDINEEVKLLK